VDVLQCVGIHPAVCVAEFTPRLWKQRFADKPLRSALHSMAVVAKTPGSGNSRYSVTWSLFRR
jgi:hypothetical protein